MNRAERNLIFWTRLVGLPPSFPELTSPADTELMSHTVMDEPEIEALRVSLASHQNTQIVVDPGWGCTTLFRHAVKDARDRAIDQLSLPIALDLEKQFQRAPLTSSGLESEIKRQILRLLLDNPWEVSLTRRYYFNCINYDNSIELARYKAEMLEFLADRSGDPMPIRKLTSRFPWLKGELSEQLNYLLANLRIQTALYIHFPNTLDSQGVRNFIFAIKAVTDRSPLDHAAWREVYFCSPRQRQFITLDFERSFNTMAYPRYNAAQIYAMLVKRYHPRVPGSQRMGSLGLGEVFADSFITRAWHGAHSLTDVVSRARIQMLERLDCPEAEIPFKLDPRRETEGGAVAASQEEEPTPARRRFQGRRGVGETRVG